ncbi:type II toxin-antitoxin system HicB family antitoxin [Desulfosporosinus nitroreducens]|uniref:Type II toxin-antitoxin system HicB family antitoxin n=1 Tax=Desulfosporosinus nitroreducens TaxID=2018668 RepID=A0ABT8QLJ9_9FIRM|nr:type II toxin-antitoxin system HicB family antitoxin [Desulfosporosinus nitroreducens]MCO1603221.1 type II toxin-antitoxin system HicB family antitoxin [Desulfosporosinus nitroreducens]MDO0822218.1 type II toxin-antitoxin system HicB family antitoxin [Desulfosporosinus nitroreducens]
MSNRFKIVLDFNEEDGGFTVTVPALPGCITEGDTIEEALTNAKEVIKGYLKALEIQGRPIPQGEFLPFDKQELVISV